MSVSEYAPPSVESSSPPETTVSQSDVNAALLAELRAMRTELAAVKAAQPAVAAKPVTVDPFVAHAMTVDTHSDALVAAMHANGDQPRTVEMDLAGDVKLCLGIRGVYFADGTGRIAVVTCQWIN